MEQLWEFESLPASSGDAAVALHNPPHLTVAEIAGADHSGEGAGDILTPALAALENWLKRD